MDSYFYKRLAQPRYVSAATKPDVVAVEGMAAEYKQWKAELEAKLTATELEAQFAALREPLMLGTFHATAVHCCSLGACVPASHSLV